MSGRGKGKGKGEDDDAAEAPQGYQGGDRDPPPRWDGLDPENTDKTFTKDMAI